MIQLTDREIIELTLPPQIFLGVVMNGVDPSKESMAAVELLIDATAEILEPYPRPVRKKLLRRSKRAHDDATAPYREPGQPVALLGLVSFYWLQALVDQRFFVVPEHSTLQRGLDLVLPALSPAARDAEFDALAHAEVPNSLRRLQALGYFRGVRA
ncbi:hypothetical protein [Azorhizobium doebereinerae]|uniref:hypothetical protein n=1 Tax=Azorhizobium doebereinerae TaxID=281091 RepID=UPI00048D69B6|nr:hypothetical protein [Azorhizobium doebereinerae]